MAKKEFSAYHKCHIQDTCWWGGLLLGKDVVSIFYSPTPPAVWWDGMSGKRTSLNLHWVFLVREWKFDVNKLIPQASETSHWENADGAKYFLGQLRMTLDSSAVLTIKWPCPTFWIGGNSVKYEQRNISRCIKCHLCYSYKNITMGKTKELSLDVRQRIINFHKSGNRCGTIYYQYLDLRNSSL